MQKPYQLALHIFRRDLRLADNTALIEALTSSHSVIPCFIFDPRQIEENEYKSENCIEFMVQSLRELDSELVNINSRLYCFYGKTEDIIERLLSAHAIQAVFVNRDYTPYARQRDHHIGQICHHHDVHFHSFADALLHEPEEVLKPNGRPYTVFTHFYRRALELKVAKPQKNPYSNYYHKPIDLEDKHILNKLGQHTNPNLAVKGGRQEAVALIRKMKTLTSYGESRNIPSLEGTTKLSAHNKFGTLSIRELYISIVTYFSPSHPLINEIHWRDFFTHISYHFSTVFSQSFNPKYQHLKWSDNQAHFHAWCEGRTGFPIVDAGMRELNMTGYMHNRVRMITASFLTKDLHIDWRWGEKYFAQKLVDYDPAVNNGNWQWAASTGCDAQPYFRIFNPWLQQLKFDPDCVYIKRWVAELSSIPNKTIHELYKHTSQLMTNYPNPMVDHAIESQHAKRMYKEAD